MVTWLVYKAIKKIVGFFVSIITLPYRIIKSIITVAKALYNAKSVIGSYLSFLPAEVYAIIAIMIAFAIFYKIVGREG